MDSKQIYYEKNPFIFANLAPKNLYLFEKPQNLKKINYVFPNIICNFFPEFQTTVGHQSFLHYQLV